MHEKALAKSGLSETGPLTRQRADELLDAAGNSVRVAIVMEKKKISRAEAERLLARAGGRIRGALV